MKKLLLVVGMVLGIGAATASAQSTGTADVAPIIALGNASMSGSYAINTFTPVITPAANTNGVHIKTICSLGVAETSLTFSAKTTTPTTTALGKVFCVGFGDVVGYQLNSTTEYYIPAGYGVWFYPSSTTTSTVFVGVTWDVN